MKVRAHANIALAKYWGKLDTKLNLPAVPSLSMTLAALYTDTEVFFEDGLTQDEISLNGASASASQTRRIVELLDRIRLLSHEPRKARVVTSNNFPTASGLASSASGFAALTVAASRATGLDLAPEKLSALARRSSVSAARSLFEAFVELERGTKGDDSLAARAVTMKEPWNLCMVIALAGEQEKKIGSTEAMNRSAETSPYYSSWLDQHAPVLFKQIKQALLERDLPDLGSAMEQSTLCMHTTALTAVPAIYYWNAATLNAMQTVRELRETNAIPVWFTMDAGAHLKALCEKQYSDQVAVALAKVPGISKTIVSGIGPGVAQLP